MGCWISLGEHFLQQDPDGNAFKRFAVLFMSTSNSIAGKLVPIELRSTLLESKSEFAAISHTWRSRPVGA
jgi:hypothetical protein